MTVTAVPAETHTGTGRADTMWLFGRMSGTSAHALELAVEQTTAQHPDRPGSAWLRDVGTAPLRHPDRYGATLIDAATTTLCLLPVPTAHADGRAVSALLGLRTPARRDATPAGDELAEAFERILEDARPVEVVAGRFLPRNGETAAQVLSTLGRHADRLHDLQGTVELTSGRWSLLTNCLLSGVAESRTR